MKTLLPEPSNLADLKKPWVRITFIHSDGKEHEFWAATNELTGSQLSAFDSNHPDIDEPLAWVKSVVRDIRKQTTVTGFGSSKHFK